MKIGNTEVSDIATLNLLSDCKEKLNIKTRVELSYIFMHELIHYRQRDMFYKWLIQIVVCVHWFNPFAYLLEKEVNKTCELSCDEKVISMLDEKARREYGDTLISFMKSNNLCKNSCVSLTLSEGAEQLKERLGAIMNFKKKCKVIRILTDILTLCIIFAAALAGNYHGAGASMSANINIPLLMPSDDVPVMETLEIKGTIYYLVSNEAQLRAIGTGAYDDQSGCRDHRIIRRCKRKCTNL